MKPVIDRVMNKVVFSDTPFAGTPCWIWTGGKNNQGYGMVHIAGRSMGLTHRAAYESLVAAIPVGLEIDHLCRVRLCCNPAHLEPVDRRTNSVRGMGPTLAGIRQRSVTHCPRGHAYDAENTHVNTSGGRVCRTCSRNRYKSEGNAA